MAAAAAEEEEEEEEDEGEGRDGDMVNPVCNRVSRSVNLSRLGKLLLSLEQSYVATGQSQDTRAGQTGLSGCWRTCIAFLACQLCILRRARIKVDFHLRVLCDVRGDPSWKRRVLRRPTFSQLDRDPQRCDSVCPS